MSRPRMRAPELDVRLELSPLEREFQGQVLEVASLLGWKHWHNADSRRSTAGIPDLMLVRAPQLLWRELKVPGGRVEPAQAETMALLAACGQDVAVWWPADLASGRVARELRRF